jgi:hypothetical protein
MTTSSSRVVPEAAKPPKPTRRKVVMPPRYYRCRGPRACPGTQTSADEIEQRVLAWLRKPTGEISPAANVVLMRYAPIWEVLFPQVVNRLVAQLVWEVQWDGAKDRFTVVLDETAIAEEYAKLKLRDEEHANRKKPRRRKAKRGESTSKREGATR